MPTRTGCPGPAGQWTMEQARSAAGTRTSLWRPIVRCLGGTGDGTWSGATSSGVVPLGSDLLWPPQYRDGVVARRGAARTTGRRPRGGGTGPVSRDDVLGQLSRVVDQAIAGRGHLLLLAGEAGIGKTTVLTEAARYAEGQGPGSRGAGAGPVRARRVLAMGAGHAGPRAGHAASGQRGFCRCRCRARIRPLPAVRRRVPGRPTTGCS
jgi:hypothetical protein